MLALVGGCDYSNLLNSSFNTYVQLEIDQRAFLNESLMRPILGQKRAQFLNTIHIRHTDSIISFKSKLLKLMNSI